MIASLSLHHVTDPGIVLDHVCDVLAPGGALVVMGLAGAPWPAPRQHRPASADARFATALASSGPYYFPDLLDADATVEQAAIDAGALKASCLRYAGLRAADGLQR